MFSCKFCLRLGPNGLLGVNSNFNVAAMARIFQILITAGVLYVHFRREYHYIMGYIMTLGVWPPLGLYIVHVSCTGSSVQVDDDVMAVE